MDSALFNDWLLSFDQKMAAENRKVLLVIDNCPAHSQTDRHLKATELLYLPPNATCKLQPCDQGVIQNLKVHFRKLLLTKAIRHIEAGADTADFQITLLGALSDLKLAWDMVTASTVKNCFRTVCFAVDEETSRKTPSDQGEEQPSTGSSAPGTADYPLPGENTEPLLSRLLKEWNISSSEYFSVDENIVTSGPEETATCTGPSTSATVTSQDCDSDHDDCGEAEEPVTRKEVLEHVHRTDIYLMQFVCWLVGCLKSQQQASVSQGRICSDNFTCRHTEIEVADPTFHLTQVTVYWHRAYQSQCWPYNARRLAG